MQGLSAACPACMHTLKVSWVCVEFIGSGFIIVTPVKTAGRHLSAAALHYSSHGSAGLRIVLLRSRRPIQQKKILWCFIRYFWQHETIAIDARFPLVFLPTPHINLLLRISFYERRVFFSIMTNMSTTTTSTMKAWMTTSTTLSAPAQPLSSFDRLMSHRSTQPPPSSSSSRFLWPLAAAGAPTVIISKRFLRTRFLLLLLSPSLLVLVISR